ncbi:serine carboxypeptidase 1 isoform X4 [Sorghum bicolor]|uniref:serine carboxypeptidase 1 isoform X4 n=1 Tax=Sorghum bicolor TaxID=4558 RepID=UPI000B425812|nr:serine carboxypeptidase 1 isoform X4 [Sorghum bicolor]|eukprot:XP_021314257.1 serine carboxypeptidase 1 isoform X4 [Sorghum bicolor]
MSRPRILASVEAGVRLLRVAAAAAAVLLCLSVHLGRAAPLGAEVAEFPGFEGNLPSKHYAGYITVGHEQQKRHLYYYLAISERNPSLDPVVIWINGGPACSGFSAFLHSIGPFKMEGSQVHINDGPRVTLNPYSWTKMASLILVDSPAGVGYSYADTEDDYTTNDTSRVVDLYDFLSKWFAEYSEFLSNPFYIAGCSYSGVIVPVLAQEILKRNEESGGMKINFKGYSLCNPAIDVDIENNAHVPYAFRMGLISDELFQVLLFQTVWLLHVMESIGITPIHRAKGTWSNFIWIKSWPLRNSLIQIWAEKNCMQKKVEVSGSWKRCPKRVLYTRDILTLIEYHLNITSKGYRVFVYSGDHSLLVPFTATMEWLKKLNYNEIEKWHPWFVENQIAGYSIRYENNILFATIKGAGHVPSDYLPLEVFVAYQRWIDGAASL